MLKPCSWALRALGCAGSAWFCGGPAAPPSVGLRGWQGLLAALRRPQCHVTRTLHRAASVCSQHGSWLSPHPGMGDRDGSSNKEAMVPCMTVSEGIHCRFCCCFVTSESLSLAHTQWKRNRRRSFKSARLPGPLKAVSSRQGLAQPVCSDMVGFSRGSTSSARRRAMCGERLSAAILSLLSSFLKDG